jgi:uncharacterized YigZ family protein
MSDTFLTPKYKGASLYKEKGSKFYGICLKVTSVKNAKEEIKKIAKEFHDSRHVCFAYRVDPLQPIERSNDDGEPSNSAGTPILNQIYSFESFNVLVVVVRYFGGTKLGVPGLIRSYKQAAKEAIEDAGLLEQILVKEFKLTADYAHVDKMMRFVKKHKLPIKTQTSDAVMTLVVEVRLSWVEMIEEQLGKENHIIFDQSINSPK